ncbi:multicopper oxidase domain-containing protein [Pseudomonas putida CSV86]|uniref:Multicopper oxidase domain-containing protein n=1 Tax=Pseudomonas bharatica CSV86 TaxID=1005395 RepID=A0A7K4ENY4_9PSED|nr:multicopper oxidase domain-containing protein [Pseudomonas bharatica]NNJ18999.1 multicopper oxidase domain-containing protein [Pseudomonas bharatica CSV86]
MTGLHRHRHLALSALALMCAAATAQAAQERAFNNPPSLEQAAPTLEAARGTLLMSAEQPVNAAPQPHAGRERLLDLVIQYTHNTIYNPGTRTYVPVYLRSYTGTDVDPQVPFVAPTIDVTPGDTVRINLDNRLPPDETCTATDPAKMNNPHCFNGTNLHSHGLWVSPAGNSDNVLLKINPEQKFQYEYNIPSDHPAGTFWYHPHLHGSTALQVGSGMAGALVIRGDRLPKADKSGAIVRNGDIDTLLKPIKGQEFPERLLVMQQIPYACVGDKGEGPVKKKKIVEKGQEIEVVDWSCKEGEIGVVKSYDQFSPKEWQRSGRYTSINGLVQPVFTARTGEVQRWRLVHAGIRDTITLKIVKLKDNKQLSTLETPQSDAIDAAKAFIDQSCTGETVPYEVIAADGLTYAKAQGKETVTLQPGYRHDLLVSFPSDGGYCLIDESSPQAGSVSQENNTPQLLGYVKVEGKAVSDGKEHIKNTLIAAAQKNMPEGPVRSKVVADLKDGLQLNSFVPHRTVEQSELQPEVQKLVFNIFQNKEKVTQFAIGETAETAKAYQPGVVDRELKLGNAQQWQLQSALAGHPFHIHVNPFQIEKIIGPDGKTDLSEPGAVDVDGDTQYAGLKGVWKDTLFVKPGVKNKADPNKLDYYTVYVNTRYERYIGEFVLHCHILDHEDQGMMQNVRISLDGKSGDAHSGH